MPIGTGIAIAGIWVSVGMCALSPSITGAGMMVAAIIACVFTTAALRG